MADWFREQGTQPAVAAGQVGELALVGRALLPARLARRPPRTSTTRRRRSHVSVFVVPQGVRLDDRLAADARGDSVRLLRLEGEVVGIVGEQEADVQAFETALRPVLAAWASR